MAKFVGVLFATFVLSFTQAFKSDTLCEWFDVGCPDSPVNPTSNLAQVAKQDWGYVDVRKDAHVFWWLFETTHPDGVYNRPLILWIQGGPGLSGTGYGNFQLLGPLDKDMNLRNTSWVTEASVLFVDNPVGTGFSYVDNNDALARDIDTITSDLLKFMTHFLDKHRHFKTAPLYIMGQSYGGKMTAAFAKTLYQATDAGLIESNLRGFAMGNSWISAADSIMAYGPLLLDMCLIDATEFEVIQSQAEECVQAMEDGLWMNSTSLFMQVAASIMEYTDINFYNILRFEDTEGEEDRRRWLPSESEKPVYLGLVDPMLEPLMNGQVRDYLGVIPNNVTWIAEPDPVYMYQLEELNKPVVDKVAWMLENTDVTAVVYQGQLDLICDIRGALAWVSHLEWSGLEGYNQASKEHLRNPVTHKPEMFLKAFENFMFFWVMDAGHAVPEDQPEVALRMIQRIISAD